MSGWSYVKTATIITGAGIVSVAAFPIALRAVGYTRTGVAPRSYAAGAMSDAAVANGGGVAAGSTVAVLQSNGAAGLGIGSKIAVGSVGAGLAAVVVKVLKRK